MYLAWGAVYQLDTPEWDDLMPEERHLFIARAQDALDGLTPDPCILPLLELVVRSRRVLRFPEVHP
jgi:hypothetical protein